FFSSRRRHTRFSRDWSSDVCSSDLIGVIPRLVNQSTHMQAASPAIESSRIFALLGVGLDSLEVLAYVIMAIAALSILISLYNARSEERRVGKECRARRAPGQAVRGR